MRPDLRLFSAQTSRPESRERPRYARAVFPSARTCRVAMTTARSARPNRYTTIESFTTISGAVVAGTAIPPTRWPVAESYHVNRRFLAPRESTASTWDERPTARGTPIGFAWLTTVPFETSTTGTVALT